MTCDGKSKREWWDRGGGKKFEVNEKEEKKKRDKISKEKKKIK